MDTRTERQLRILKRKVESMQGEIDALQSRVDALEAGDDLDTGLLPADLDFDDDIPF